MKRTFVLMLGLAVALFIVGCANSASTTLSTSSPTTGPGTSSSLGSSSTIPTTPGVGSAGGATGGATGTSFTAQLSGANAVPSNPSMATGTATFTLSSDGSSMSFELKVDGVKDATAAHIHAGPQGTEGPVVAPLFTGPPKTGSFSGTLAQGTITSADLKGDLQGKTMADLAALIQSGQAYVNVHTTAYPGGEIRGQIESSDSSANQNNSGSTATTAGGSPGGAGSTMSTSGSPSTSGVSTGTSGSGY